MQVRGERERGGGEREEGREREKKERERERERERENAHHLAKQTSSDLHKQVIHTHKGHERRWLQSQETL